MTYKFHAADTITYEEALRKAHEYALRGLYEMEKFARERAEKALRDGRRENMSIRSIVGGQ